MDAEIARCFLIAGACGLLLFFSRFRAPLLADEGYLWYGLQQLVRGRMPHRDFKSYEPGRYLWAGLVALVNGTGLLTVRISTHLFFAVALAPALFVLRELGLSWTSVVLAAVALAAWSYPQHKQFECGWWPVTWAAYTHALLDASPVSFGLAGAITGLALLLGFNLFLYSAAALVLTCLAGLLAGQAMPDLPALAFGTVVGAAPFLSFLLSPRFARAFYRRRIGSVLSRGTANLPLPRPWPWRRIPAAFDNVGAIRGRGFQWLFVVMAAMPIIAAPFTLVEGERLGPVALGIVSACALAFGAAHHALSRADPPHIAQSVGPVCILSVLVADWAGGAVITAGVAGAFVWLAWPLHRPSWRSAGAFGGFARRQIGGLLIDVSNHQAALLDHAAALCRVVCRGRADFFTAPFYPELYASLLRESPVYDTFCVYPADERAQQEMIAALARAQVRAALVSNAPVDGRDELRFSETHPLVWRHLHAHLSAAQVEELGRDVVIFRARALADAGGGNAATR